MKKNEYVIMLGNLVVTNNHYKELNLTMDKKLGLSFKSKYEAFDILDELKERFDKLPFWITELN